MTIDQHRTWTRMAENTIDGRDIRIKVPAKLWGLLEEVAKLMGVSTKTCLALLFQDLEHLVETEQIGALGYRYTQAARQLQEQHEREEERVRVTDPDLTRLHRSDKTKSGFVGVYSNGKGYRAEGRDPVSRKGTVTLGTFPDAEAAALARLKHYKHYELAYGQLEELMATYREREHNLRDMSDERVKHEVIWSEANIIKRPIEGLTDAERALEKINPNES